MAGPGTRRMGRQRVQATWSRYRESWPHVVKHSVTRWRAAKVPPGTSQRSEPLGPPSTGQFPSRSAQSRQAGRRAGTADPDDLMNGAAGGSAIPSGAG